MPDGAERAFSALYPFLSTTPAQRSDGGSDVMQELRRSTERKLAEAAALREWCLQTGAEQLRACAAGIAVRVRRGGRVLTMGNGGSSTDASALAALFVSPPGDAAPVPAMCLTEDPAILTALANDVGFDVVFGRQIATLAAADDVVIALSTSGNSPNLIRGLEQADRAGALTVGLAGYDGGAMAAWGRLDHLFAAPASSVHRIQEAQTTIYHVLWELTQHQLRGVTAPA